MIKQIVFQLKNRLISIFFPHIKTKYVKDERTTSAIFTLLNEFKNIFNELLSMKLITKFSYSSLKFNE